MNDNNACVGVFLASCKCTLKNHKLKRPAENVHASELTKKWLTVKKDDPQGGHTEHIHFNLHHQSSQIVPVNLTVELQMLLDFADNPVTF